MCALHRGYCWWTRVTAPFLIGQKSRRPPTTATKGASDNTDAWKYANHNNIAIEPQLILCYEDFKGHHLPDIHNKGINGKEGKKCKKTQMKNSK